LPVNFTEAELREGCKRCIDNVKGLLDSALLLLNHKNSQQYGLGLYMYAVEEFGKAILLRRYVTGNKSKYQLPLWIFGKGGLKFESLVQDNILRELLNRQIQNPDNILALCRILKQLLVKEHLSNTKKKIILRILDGVSTHNVKLLIGFNNLPDVCSMFSRGIKVSTPFTSNKIISVSQNKKVVVGSGQTGEFLDTTNIDIEHVTKAFRDPEKILRNLRKCDIDQTALHEFDLIAFVDLDLKTACFYMDWDTRNKSWKYDMATDSNELKDSIGSFKEALVNFDCVLT
jgi:hypothetical protein